MIVIADTSPLNYLIQLDLMHLLPALYGRVLVPASVIHELSHVNAPTEVSVWLDALPAWIDVAQASTTIPELAYLGRGEREAIELAKERKADLLLIDERVGAHTARHLGFDSIGVLGLLLAAGEANLIDPEVAYQRLRNSTSFRLSRRAERSFLALLHSS